VVLRATGALLLIEGFVSLDVVVVLKRGLEEAGVLAVLMGVGRADICDIGF
jgi:hypothetical protein